MPNTGTAIALVVCLLNPVVALAQPEQGAGERLAGEAEAAPRGRGEAELAELIAAADDAWFFGQYAEVIAVLEPLVLPEPDPGLTEEQLTHVYELLGASLHFEFGEERSREAFVALLFLEPDHELDPFVFPASMIRMFDELRLEFEEELDAIRRERRDQTPAGQLFIGRTVERRHIIVSMIPFGVGHYLNDETGWGTFYLASELVLGGLSLGMFVANESARRSEVINGSPVDFYADPQAAETRQAIQIAAGIAFFVVLASNMVHGAVIHEDVIETSYEILEEPPDDFFTPTAPPAPRSGVFFESSDDGFVAGFGLSF